MMRSSAAAVAMLASALGMGLPGCTPERPATGTPGADSAAVPPVAEMAPTSPANAATHPAASSAPALPMDAPSAAEARQVVVDYYAALNARDYRRAYDSWSDAGAASGQSFEHFSGGYANTESVAATVGQATDEEGAAGSRYINVPVELESKQYNGTTRHYQGRFTLRAVVADGASDAQRRWHLSSAEMQRLP